MKGNVKDSPACTLNQNEFGSLYSSVWDVNKCFCPGANPEILKGGARKVTGPTSSVVLSMGGKSRGGKDPKALKKRDPQSGVLNHSVPKIAYENKIKFYIPYITLNTHNDSIILKYVYRKNLKSTRVIQ